MNSEPYSQRKSYILAVHLHFTSSLSRWQSRMNRVRTWVSFVLVVFGFPPPPCIPNGTRFGVHRCWLCSELTLKASGFQSYPKKSNLCLILLKQLEDFFGWWSCIKNKEKNIYTHQTSCYTRSPVIGGHSEVITLNGYVTETELGWIDGITPWAPCYTATNHSATEQ